MTKKLTTLFHTLRSLKWTQIKYQVLYRLQKVKSFSSYKADFSGEVTSLSFKMNPPVYPAYFGENRFSFLNKEKQFPKETDWNFMVKHSLKLDL